MSKELLRRFLVTSDWHIRYKNPRNRRDFFYATQKMKVRWILSLYDKLQCDALLVAGDIFDSSASPYLCNGDYIRMFRFRNNINFLCIFGQHDLRYHSLRSKKNTPLWSFLSALGTTTIDNNPYIDSQAGIGIYGASWSQQIPVINSKTHFNILLLHSMVVRDQPLFVGQDESSYIKSHTLLQNNSDFNVIISGDNHQSFSVRSGTQLLINPGTIVRKSLNEKDYTIRVGILDIYTDFSFDFEWYYIPIKPQYEVFKQSDSVVDEIDSELTSAMNSFIQKLQNHNTEKIRFLDTLRYSLQDLQDSDVISIIEDLLSRLKRNT